MGEGLIFDSNRRVDGEQWSVRQRVRGQLGGRVAVFFSCHTDAEALLATLPFLG